MPKRRANAGKELLVATVSPRATGDTTDNNVQQLGTDTNTAAHDRISWLRVSSVTLPLNTPISDAKVLTGRQKPMTEVAMLFVEVTAESGYHGIGFSYSKRAGGPGQFAHAREIAPTLLGEDPNDIARLWDKLAWSAASVGRSGLGVQAIAAFDIALYDLKAHRADLPLAKLLGSHRDSVRCFNTSGGFLHTPIKQVVDNAHAALADGIGGIKIKVGHPDRGVDLERVSTVRDELADDVPLMVDANQQWDRPRARRLCRGLERFELSWIEEPLDAYDVGGHAALSSIMDTPIATGEMLASAGEHAALIQGGGADILQPDAPRIGGITPFLTVLAHADSQNLDVAPHFAMQIHLHLAAIYPRETWVEHFDWLDPLFTEQLDCVDGRMLLPDRPGLGISLSDRARAWTVASAEFGR